MRIKNTKYKIAFAIISIMIVLVIMVFAMTMLSSNNSAYAAETSGVYGQLYLGDYLKPATIKEIPNGYYTNTKSYVGYMVPEGYGFDMVQTKQGSPDFNSSSSWATTNFNFIISVPDGWYYFRAKNSATGDVSEPSCIYFDRVKPTLQVKIDGNSVPSGTITSISNAKITLAGQDEVGIANYYYKKSSDINYTICNAETVFTDNAKYSFYVEDLAGNVSETIVVSKDSLLPSITVYNGTTLEQLSNNAITSSTHIKFTAIDEISGIEGIYINHNNTGFLKYTGTSVNLYNEGTYEFYAKDNASNQSITRKVTLDRTPPILKVLAGSSELASETAINAISLKCTVDKIATCYYKIEGGTYKEFNTNTVFTEENIYYFYAEDIAKNKSEEIMIILDRTPPVDDIYVNGDIFTKAYTNDWIMYYAIDVSDINIYVKLPGSTEFILTDNCCMYYDEGTYIFYAVDAANNKSIEKTITIDTTSPTGTINADSITNLNGQSWSNSLYITFNSTDNLSGIESLYVKLPNADSFSTYVANSRLYEEGSYSFYTIDSALNQSLTYTIIVDRSLPIGTILSESDSVENGSYINKSFSYIVADTLSGITRCEIKKPNGNWEDYEQGTEIVKMNENGWYSFRSYNNLGTLSNELCVYLDTITPTCLLFSEENTILCRSFTNVPEISFKAIDDNLLSCYVKLPKSSSFIETTSGAYYFEEGYYEFYADDKSGNKTEVCSITIDRSIKVLSLENVENDTTTKNVIISWVDTEGYAPIVSVTLNGCRYEKGSIIKTINNGVYKVISRDAADNLWVYEFSATRVDIETVTLKNCWWEAKDSLNKVYSFSSYENAFNFAYQRELNLIQTRTWNSGTWDAGLAMDSVDSVNAKQGTFYVYKKHDNPSIQVAYFTENRIHEVAKSYAEKDLIKYYYFQKSPAPVYIDNNLTFEDYILTNNLKLFSDPNFLINGSKLSTSTFDEQGDYILTVYDDFGNSYTQRLVIVKDLSTVYFGTEKGNSYKATNEQAYYLKDKIVIKIVDKLDEFAMAIIKNSNGDTIKLLKIGDEFILKDSGLYIVQVTNHSGNYEEYTFNISINPPTIAVTKDENPKKIIVNFEPSSDNIFIESIKIFKTMDGINWTALTEDDYGTVIQNSILSYSFNQTAYYRFVIEDSYRTGIDAIVYEYYYERPALIQPSVELVGVTNGGSTKGKVLTKNLTEDTEMTVYHNGNIIDYRLGESLDEIGSYKIILTSSDGITNEYAFKIEDSLNTSSILIIIISVIAAILLVATIIVIRKRKMYKPKKKAY